MMKPGAVAKIACGILAFAFWLTSWPAMGQNEPGFISLFDGKTFDGWKLLEKKGDGYGIKDGLIFCAKRGGGNLLTEKEFSDFILLLQYNLTPTANHGFPIRAPPPTRNLLYLRREI